jgi:hypothetical protein
MSHFVPDPKWGEPRWKGANQVMRKEGMVAAMTNQK